MSLRNYLKGIADALRTNGIGSGLINAREFADNIYYLAENKYSAGIAEGYRRGGLDYSPQETVSGEAIGITDISPIEHNMSVKISGVEDISTVKLYKGGKNLLPLSFTVELPYTTNGITFDYNGDGGIKVSGTATDYASINYKNVVLVKGLIYKLAHINGLKGVNTFISYKDENGTSQLYATKTNANFTFNDTYTYSRTFLQVDKGVTVNQVIYPMLVLSTADRTEYEPYIEPTVYDVPADGIVEGVKSLYPNTTLYTDTQGAVIDCTYYQDGKKVKENLTDMILSLGGVINE